MLVSLFPTTIGVNPMIIIQSIAHCIARRIVEILKIAIFFFENCFDGVVDNLIDMVFILKYQIHIQMFSNAWCCI